jgi:hypothetical protein
MASTSVGIASLPSWSSSESSESLLTYITDPVLLLLLFPFELVHIKVIAYTTYWS